MAGVLGRVFITPCGVWNKKVNYKDLSLVSVRMEKKIVTYVSDDDIPSGTEITDVRWVPWFEIEDGKDGKNGADGQPGVTGATGATGKPFTYEDFTPEQLAALKVKGDNGKTGATGADGTNGKDGTDGIDGKSVTAITLTKNADGVITGGTATLSDGSSTTITVTESVA